MKPILNHRGFSLIEVIVALSVLSGGILASVWVTQQVGVQNELQKNLSDMEQLIDSVRSQFQNPLTCSELLGGQVLPATLPADYRAGAGFPDLGILPNQAYQSLNVVSIQWVADSPTILTSYIALPTGPGGSLEQSPVLGHILTLRFGFVSKNPAYQTLNTIPKYRTISLTVGVNSANTIKSCLGNGADAAVTCATLGGVLNGNKCQLDVTSLCTQMAGTLMGSQCKLHH